jgi:site-specific recombinase XerD
MTLKNLTTIQFQKAITKKRTNATSHTSQKKKESHIRTLPEFIQQNPAEEINISLYVMITI